MTKTLQFESCMKPRSSPASIQLDLFQAQPEHPLNLDHALGIFAKKVDWKYIESGFADRCCLDFEAPGRATCLLVGLD